MSTRFIPFFVLNLFLSMAVNIAAYAESTAIIVDKAGFEYDYEQNLYKTKKDALQRFFGFNRGYDYMATILSMVIDAEPITFLYNDKWYMIELWKGQYYASTGGEIGFYTQSTVDGHWTSANDEQMLQISYILTKNGQKIFTRSGLHWWLTGFKPGLFSEPNELALEDIQIEFKEPDMGEAFYKALIEYFTPELSQTVYKVSFTAPNTVNFRWEIPKKTQDHLEKRKYFQMWNRVSAKALFVTMNPNYSPENIDKKLVQLKHYLKFTPIDADDILGFLECKIIQCASQF